MATNKNITMKQFNGTDYDTLYPKTIVEQVDGVYNKQEVIEDTTKSMFGYGSSAIPDTIFQWLGKYNLYWWKRRAVTDKGSWNYIYSSNRNAYPDSGVGDAYHYEPVLGSSSTGYLVSTNTGNSSLQNTIYYSNSIIIDTSGNISLESEQSIVLSYSSTSQANTLKGKYIRGVMNTSYEVDTSTIYYIPSDSSDATSRWDNSYTPAIALMISMQKVTTQQVVNTNAYEYKYLGIPFDNAVNTPKFEMHSYTGTGLYGSTHANSLVFDFEPLLLIIASASSRDLMLAVNYNGKNVGFSMISGSWNSFSSELSNPNFTWGKTVSWYSTKNATYQMNSSDTDYVVYAFR